MKTNLTEGDYQICELLRGLWHKPAMAAKDLNRELEDIQIRMAKLHWRGLLDFENGFYRLNPARRLVTNSKSKELKKNGDRWVVLQKTPEQKEAQKIARAIKNKASAEMRRYIRANPGYVPPVVEAPSKWYGFKAALEIKSGVKRFPKCYNDLVEYQQYLIEMRDSGQVKPQGICTDCDRATMERMGARCEAPEGIKARMTA